MATGMAAVSANVRYRQVVKETERIINAFAFDPHLKHRATIKVVRRILLNAPYLLNGRMWEVKAKSLGAGVYELSMELKNV